MARCAPSVVVRRSKHWHCWRWATSANSTIIGHGTSPDRRPPSPAPAHCLIVSAWEGFDMLGLTPLGIVHTAISLVAIVYGVIALLRYKEISPQNRAGQIYLIATLLTAVTALGI